MSSFKLDLGGFKQFICTNCRYVGHAAKEKKGSFLIGLILWLFFIVPGLLYTIWCLSNRKFICPMCKQSTLVPTNTPVGEKLLAEIKK